METQILAKATSWLTPEYDEDIRHKVKKLIAENEAECTDAFYRDLEFGTGGLRGLMGVGTNRMNKYTVAKTTQGLANYLKSQFLNSNTIKVAIAYDTRHNSKYFSQIIADVLTGNGIEVYLFESFRTTPGLSFAIRHLACQAGIVVTASHNPKEYNGYKVYWQDGAQIIAPHDKNIIAEIAKIKALSQVTFNGIKEKIHIIGQEVDKAFFKATKNLIIDSKLIKTYKDLGIVYTPLHGTGIMAVPQCLNLVGFENVMVEPSQKHPDGDFPTVVYPNPEEDEALKLAIEMAKKHNAELVLATDPDTDRVGVAVKDRGGDFKLLNGNQTGSLIIHYLLKALKDQDQLTGKEYIAKTIVTTRLFDEIAKAFHIECHSVLTGFKHIAEVIRTSKPDKIFVAGAEESYGYLIGDAVRDKDAVGACCVIAEIAAYAKSQHKTLLDLLKEIHLQYGLYLESLMSVTKKGKSGAEMIAAIMQTFRNKPPAEIDGSKVIQIADYQSQVIQDFISGEVKPTNLPVSNVFEVLTQDGSLITARPSGTEPKIKFYFGVVTKVNSLEEYALKEKELQAKLSRLSKYFRV